MASSVTWLLVVAACVGCTTTTVDAGAKGSAPALPNPAAVKCLADGYQLVPIYENGVPVGSWCVDPKSGARCDSWEYYRGECALHKERDTQP